MTQANTLYPPGGFGAPKNRHGQAQGNVGLPAGTEVFSADTHISLAADIFYERLPDDLGGRQCFVLDPMLATGGSLIAAINYLFDRGAVDVTCVCLIAAPEGLAAVEAEARQVDRGRGSQAVDLSI